MKNKLLFVVAILVILLCIFSPFVVSDMQNSHILEKEYVVENEKTDDLENQNLLKKIQIYKEGTVVESRRLSTYEMYTNYSYTGSEDKPELVSGFSFIWQKLQEEMTKMVEMGILPKEIMEEVSEPERAEWVLQTYVSNNLTHEAVTTWLVWFELEENNSWINLVLETGSYKIIEVYYDMKEFSQMNSEQIAKQLGIYFGTQEMIITGGRNVQYRLDGAEVFYLVEEAGIHCI